MKKNLILTLLLLMVVVAFAQETETKSTKTKKGWNFGVLPAVSYNTDLGFQYGGLINLFNYGDGSDFPAYKHNIYFEASKYTKGSGIFRLAYDSEHLIPGIRITSDLAYLPDKAFDFYGFNGYEAVYNKEWTDDGDALYKSRMFYRNQNNMFRFKTDIQFPIMSDNLLGLVGFNLQNFDVKSVDVEKMNKGRDADDPKRLPDVKTLYDEYIDWGIISEDEKNGGFIPLLKAGIVYDTRDLDANPMKGIWTEAFIFGAPGVNDGQSGFLKLNITHRQYFTLIERDLSFVYRLSYQGTIAGSTPWYYQTQIETSQMKDQVGLGGRKNLRGIMRNRVVGDGFAYANAELRWKAVYFNFINQRWYLGVNGFFDTGMVVQKLDVKKYLNNIDEQIYDTKDYFNFDEEEKLHSSYGIGLKIVMNQNFVIAVDYGRAVDPQDGKSGLYIGLDYQF